MKIKNTFGITDDFLKTVKEAHEKGPLKTVDEMAREKVKAMREAKMPRPLVVKAEQLDEGKKVDLTELSTPLLRSYVQKAHQNYAHDAAIAKSGGKNWDAHTFYKRYYGMKKAKHEIADNNLKDDRAAMKEETLDESDPNAQKYHDYYRRIQASDPKAPRENPHQCILAGGKPRKGSWEAMLTRATPDELEKATERAEKELKDFIKKKWHTKEELDIEVGDTLQINEDFFPVVEVDGDRVVVGEGEELFELNKKTLGSYVKKASDDLTFGSKGWSRKNALRIGKRRQGIERAVGRLSGEVKLKKAKSPGHDLAKLRRTYDRNENENAHTENAILLAKHFGTPEELARVKAAKVWRDKHGGYSGKEGMAHMKNCDDVQDKYTRHLFGK